MNTISVNKYNKNHKKSAIRLCVRLFVLTLISDQVKAPAFVVKCFFLS